MTFTYGAPDPYDTDLHALGGVWQQAMIATERREALKRQQQQHTRPVYQRYQPRGPVLWNPSTSSVQAPAPAAAQACAPDRRRPEPQASSAAAGYVAPSIHTILDIARGCAKVSRHDNSDPPGRDCARVIRRPQNSSQAASPLPRTGTLESGTTHTLSSSSPSPSPAASTAQGLPATLTTKPLRRGKWTRAEEVYAAATIQYFCSGLLNLQFGTLLRGFLAQQLHCHPMRISKKLLPGTRFHGVEITRKLGRRAYSPRWCDSPQATHEKLEAEQHLAMLRTKFVASLEAEDEDEGEDGGAAAAAAKDGDALSDRVSELSDDHDDHPRREAASPARKMDRAAEEEENKENWRADHNSPPVPAAYGHHIEQRPHVVGQKRFREDWASPQQQGDRRDDASPPQQQRRLDDQQQLYHRRASPQYYDPAPAHALSPDGGRHEPPHPLRSRPTSLVGAHDGSPAWHQQSNRPAGGYHDDRRGFPQPSGPPRFYPEQARYRAEAAPTTRYSYSESPRAVRAPPLQAPVLPSLRESLGRNANTRLLWGRQPSDSVSTESPTFQ